MLCVSFPTDALYLSSMAVSRELSSFLPQIDTWLCCLGYYNDYIFFGLYTQFLFKKLPSPIVYSPEGTIYQVFPSLG